MTRPALARHLASTESARARRQLLRDLDAYLTDAAHVLVTFGPWYALAGFALTVATVAWVGGGR